MLHSDSENQAFSDIKKAGLRLYSKLTGAVAIFAVGGVTLYLTRYAARFSYTSLMAALLAWVFICAVIEIIYILKKYKDALRQENLKAHYLKSVLLRVLAFSAIIVGITTCFSLFSP